MRINFHVISLLLAITTIISTAPVFASDGQLEINQACAVNTGCFPGDDPGFPVTIIQSGSYRLPVNLDLSAVDSSLNGIEVSVPAVTVDLGGFHIAGAATCSGSGASISCSPSGTGSGVHFSNDATASVVQNGIVRNMTNSGIFCLATGSRVQNITATHNRNDGIFAQQGTLVVNSVAIENGGDGVNVTSGSMVDGVTSIGNGQNGIHAEGFSGGSVVTRTIAQKNGSSGFFLFGFAKYGKNNLSIGNQDGDRCNGGICTDRTRFYLTKEKHQGDTVLAACPFGFHTASHTELQGLASYAYDYILGITKGDSGSGAPVDILSWVRSGERVLTGSGEPVNCNGWTTASSTRSGTSILIQPMINSTTGTIANPSHLYASAFGICSNNVSVWCVEGLGP